MARCPCCGAAVDPRLLALAHRVQPSLVPIIQHEVPGWTPAQGICPRCVLRAAATLQQQRAAHSIQDSTTPPTTFPYYHPAEETVLPQATRLPTHSGFDGRGVTIAFLDSGFYPHPDLMVRETWPDAPAWETLNAAQLRVAIRDEPLRLAHYVDLTDHGQREGLEVASLWDGAGDSWHGQMTV